MTEFEILSTEIARFIRYNYKLDEVAGKYYETDCLRFRQGKKTIFSINLHTDYYEFQIILGKAEREKFEAQRAEFPKAIQDLYDKERTLHDGKWLLLRVDDMDSFEVVKKLILIKKKPNRKPLSKEGAILGKCGHRCDMCIHYKKLNDELREEYEARLTHVYGVTDWSLRCGGCGEPDCYCEDGACEALKCAYEKELSKCLDCKEYPCAKATVGYQEIEARSTSADDVTWAIIPYMPYQKNNSSLDKQ